MADSVLSVADWQAMGERLFGPDKMAWRFICPACKHVASVADYQKAGAPEGAVGFSCVARWSGGRSWLEGDGAGPCDYAGGGLLRINPVKVTDGENEHLVFAFDATQMMVI